MEKVNGDFYEKQPQKVAIVGGGLVGSLAALFLAKMNYDVTIYEYREDIRKVQQAKGRSINLALSVRGMTALEQVGLKDVLIKHGIPMRGRMLHDLKGKTTFVPYGSTQKQCIYSIGRKYLNEVLLSAGEKYPNIKRKFNQKLISANLKEGNLVFKNCSSKQEDLIQTDLILGCDGAYSTVRRQMLQCPGFNFSQTYIEHGYIELCIPPLNNDITDKKVKNIIKTWMSLVGLDKSEISDATVYQFAMPENYLHIWPRGKFMMIALPNQDKSWTVTLFMPFQNFDSLKSSEELLNFFSEYFPDAVPLIGEERLIKDFFGTKAQHLISVKCYPYHVTSKALLLGDAAHAMVPFYGQGMNAGFEDCSILYNILTQSNNNLLDAISKFSEVRWENAHAICDLAMYNYVEMRDLVRKKRFRIRKAVDDMLYNLAPNIWIPLYNSVSFTKMPYKKCIENRKWQDKIISTTSIIILSGALVFCFVYYNYNKLF